MSYNLDRGCACIMDRRFILHARRSILHISVTLICFEVQAVICAVLTNITSLLISKVYSQYKESQYKEAPPYTVVYLHCSHAVTCLHHDDATSWSEEASVIETDHMNHSRKSDHLPLKTV